MKTMTDYTEKLKEFFVPNRELAPIEDGNTSSADYAVGKQFMRNSKLCKAKTAISQGDTFVLDSNYEVSDTITDQLEDVHDELDKSYKSDDASASQIDDEDFIPFFDTSAGAMKKINKANAKFGGGGSTITLTTSDDGLYGQAVTISDGVSTLTKTMSNSGECIFSGVPFTGTLTISATAEGTPVSDTLSVPYYGVYTKAIGRAGGKTIEISTDETTLIGQTATITYGSNTKTATISSSGEASVTIYGYTGDVTVSASDGESSARSTVTITSNIDVYSVELVLAPMPIYGVYWLGQNNPAMTRTDLAASFSDPVPAVNNGNGSSPFDNILPWSGMVIEEDANAGTLVKIPKYYFKWTKNGIAMTLKISSEPISGYNVSPAHADRGDGKGERDYVYVGRYHCGYGNLVSKSGVMPQTSGSRPAFRSGIHNLGSDIWQYDYAMYWTIMMLYLVEYANWNSQATIGYGCGTSSAPENMGLTDNMIYHTGTNAANRTTYGTVQYRHIEGLWDNVLDWCDGIRFSGEDIYIINNPANFSDSSGGTKIGTKTGNTGYITTWMVPSVTGFEWALYPISEGWGTNTAYVCDAIVQDIADDIDSMAVGAHAYQHTLSCGAFGIFGNFGHEIGFQHVGTRAQKLP